MNTALKSGGYIGLFSIIVGLLIYIVEPTMFVKWWFMPVMIVVSLTLVSYFGIQYRNSECEGYLSFKNAYIHTLVIFIVSGILGTAFNLLLFHVIDPDLPNFLTEAAIEHWYNILKFFGTPDNAIDEAINQMKEDIPKGFTAFGQLKNFATSMIGYLVFSLITGAIVKKKKPEFE